MRGFFVCANLPGNRYIQTVLYGKVMALMTRSRGIACMYVRKVHQLSAYLTGEEADVVERAAQAADMSISKFLRHAAVEKAHTDGFDIAAATTGKR